MKNNKLKKWVAGMMLPVTALGAVGGVLVHDYVSTSQSLVKASTITTYSLLDNTGKMLGDKSLTTEGDLYYVKINVVDRTGKYEQVYYEVSDKEVIHQGEEVDLTITESMCFDTPGKTAYIFSTDERLYQMADYLKNIPWDPGMNPWYGRLDFYSWLNTTQYSNLKDNIMLVGDPSQRTYHLNANVVNNDTTAPVFEKQVFITNVDAPTELSYILSQTKFIDAVDGEHVTTTDDVVEDNYTSNKNTLGKHLVKVKWADNAGNETIGEIEIWVQDKTAPVITGTSVFTSNMSSPLTLESIKSAIHVTDNVDTSVTLNVVEDNFTGHHNVKGEKTIKFNATDSSGNTSVIFTAKVNCVDDVKPVISLKEGFSNKFEISYTQKIELSTLVESLQITDNIDSNLTLEKIADNYSASYTIPGTYQVSYRTTDNAGNISDTYTFEIKVIDDVAPGFYVSGHFIGISQANTMSHQDIVNWLIYLEGLQEAEGAEVQLLSLDGYDTQSINKPMSYSIRYKTRVAGAESKEKTMTLKVLGEEVTQDTTDKEQAEQRVEKSKNGFVTAIKNIGEFFVKLFKSIVEYILFGWAWDKQGIFNPKWDKWY